MTKTTTSGFARCLLAVVTTAVWTIARCRADDIDQIRAYVQTVLALADRKALGLPENLSVPYHRSVVDGQLPDDLRLYLERLVGVSRPISGRDLVAAIWDDTVVVDEDQNPHEAFESVRPFMDETTRTLSTAFLDAPLWSTALTDAPSTSTVRESRTSSPANEDSRTSTKKSSLTKKSSSIKNF